MCEVTSTSLQSEALGNSVFRDLVISLSPGAVCLMMPYVHVIFLVICASFEDDQ